MAARSSAQNCLLRSGDAGCGGAVPGSLKGMAPVKRAYGPGEATAFVAGGGPPTDDDVSITNDGRRLDSAEAVLAFVEELRREQEALERTA